MKIKLSFLFFNRRHVTFIAISAILLAISGCGRSYDLDSLRDEYESQDAGSVGKINSMRITFLDVGQGDAMLLTTPNGSTVLIDAGPRGAGVDVILPYLRSNGIDDLSAIFASHYHADHIGGFSEVIAGEEGPLETYDDIQLTGYAYDRGEEEESPSQEVYNDYAAAFAGHRKSLEAGTTIELDGVRFEIISDGKTLSDETKIDAGEPPDENAKSVAMVIGFGGFRLFAGGDITGGGGEPPYQSVDVETELGKLVGDVDVIKVSHHGSKTSTNDAFLDAITPEVAVISVGNGNDFYHPNGGIVSKLMDRNIEVLQTEKGAVEPNDLNSPNAHIVMDVIVGKDTDGNEKTSYEVWREEK